MYPKRGGRLIKILAASLAVSSFACLLWKIYGIHALFQGLPRPEMAKSHHGVCEESSTGSAVTTRATDERRGPIRAEVKLILLSYMRSGSTFTADLFNQHPDVFYIYEPLWSYDFHFKKGEPLTFLDGRPQINYNNNATLLDSIQKDTIRSILSCQFQNISIPVFKVMNAPFSRHQTERIQSFLKCYAPEDTAQNLKRCMPLIQKACDTANVTMVKALRLSMKQAFTLMENDPQVKVIHLVRDPRGVLNSRQVTGIGKQYNMTAKEFCSKVLQDVNDSKTLRRRFPGRVLTVRYEDLTADPLNYTQVLLQFAGLHFSPAHRHRVWENTSAGRRISTGRGVVQRSDSKMAASKWRHQIKADFAQSMDRACSALYKQMGYISFSDEATLRNQNRPFYHDCRDVVAPTLCLH